MLSIFRATTAVFADLGQNLPAGAILHGTPRMHKPILGKRVTARTPSEPGDV